VLWRLVDGCGLAASIELGHPPHADQRVRPGPEHQLLQVADLLEVPACDAVKIRCRSRRTLSSARSQLTLCQHQDSPSGPFAAFAAPNLSFGSSVVVIIDPHGLT
jgi:hypothetical protein